MDAKRCDKCGTFFDTSEDYTVLSYKKIGSIFSQTVDLCEKCSEKFVDFLVSDRKDK